MFVFKIIFVVFLFLILFSIKHIHYHAWTLTFFVGDLFGGYAGASATRLDKYDRRKSVFLVKDSETEQQMQRQNT